MHVHTNEDCVFSCRQVVQTRAPLTHDKRTHSGNEILRIGCQLGQSHAAAKHPGPVLRRRLLFKRCGAHAFPSVHVGLHLNVRNVTSAYRARNRESCRFAPKCFSLSELGPTPGRLHKRSTGEFSRDLTYFVSAALQIPRARWVWVKAPEVNHTLPRATKLHKNPQTLVFVRTKSFPTRAQRKVNLYLESVTFS